MSRAEYDVLLRMHVIYDYDLETHYIPRRLEFSLIRRVKLPFPPTVGLILDGHKVEAIEHDTYTNRTTVKLSDDRNVVQITKENRHTMDNKIREHVADHFVSMLEWILL